MSLDELARLRPRILALAAAHGAHDIRVFGSFARGQEGPESDIDFLVSLDRGCGMLDLARLEIQLEQLLGRRVDVATAAALREPIRSTAQREARPV